jgi:hypothetical protein
VVVEPGGTTTVVFAGGGGLLLLTQPDSANAATINVVQRIFITPPAFGWNEHDFRGAAVAVG